ncbi:MAG: alpha/beta hydrolase, partial [Pseudomonadota bacterium]
RLYKPEGLADPAPTLLYLHGGGWALCSPDTHDALCRRLARAGGFAVASLDYGLAPEHPFPEPVEDCVAAARWLAENGLELGLDASRMAIGGDSAGANLSLATLMALRDRGTQLFTAGVLIYGMYDDDFTTESHQAFGEGFYLTTDDIMWFWEQYIPDPVKRHDPLAAAIHGDLNNLPPLYVTAAALDPLKSDSDKLASKLGQAGAEFEYQVWPGVTHACLMMSRMLDRADDFIADIAQFVDQRLGGGPVG